MTLGRALRALRLCREMTLDEMAARLDVSKTHLSDIERGSVERAARWAEVLGESPTAFVRLVLEDEVRRAGLDFAIAVSAPTPRAAHDLKRRRRPRTRTRA